MKALVFAAGLGTRLKPFTETHPKALFPIQGTPLLEHVLLRLKAAGFTDIVINIHHFGEQIIQFVEAKEQFGLSIQFSDERGQLLETGGGIKKAKSLLGEQPFLIHNVDILSNADLHALYHAHLQNNADSTLLVSERASSRRLFFDKNDCLVAWKNMQSGETKPLQANIQALRSFAFSGIHVFSPTLFASMNEYPDRFPIMDFYLDHCQNAKIKAFVQEDLQLIDVGKIESIKQAEAFINRPYAHL